MDKDVEDAEVEMITSRAESLPQVCCIHIARVILLI
jgi:hypothetical protein